MAHVRPEEGTIPSRFNGWLYGTWTLADLREVAATIGLDVQDGIQKRDLYQLIVELKPEPKSLSLVETDAIQAIKDAKTASKATSSKSQGDLLSTKTTPATRKRQSPAKYRGMHRKRRWTDNVAESSSDSEYVDSDDSDDGETSRNAVRSSPRTASYAGSTYSSLSSPSSVLTRLDEFAIPEKDAESSQSSPHAKPIGHPLGKESCEVCSEPLSRENRLLRKPTLNCLHDHNFICLSCFQQHITASIMSRSWENIACPHDSCTAMLCFDDMQLFAPPEIFARYDKYINKKGLAALNDYVECSNVQCDSGGIIDSVAHSFATCSLCGTQTCVTCKTQYHPGLTHAENLAVLREAEDASSRRAQERQEEEAASETFVAKRTKTCPNLVCGFRIQKISGCNHMTCKYETWLLRSSRLLIQFAGAQCGHEFCWICLADFDAIRRHGNAQHAKTCKLHSSRLK